MACVLSSLLYKLYKCWTFKKLLQFISHKILFHLQPKLKNIAEKITEIQNERFKTFHSNVSEFIISSLLC